MANITLEQWSQGGQLAAAISRANEAIDSFDKRIAAAVPIVTIMAIEGPGGQIREDFPLDKDEVVKLYEFLKGIAVEKRDAMKAALDALAGA